MLPRYTCLTAVVAAISSSAPFTALGANDPITITITGTRTAQTVDESLAPVKVITRAQIEQSQATHMDDLLQGQAGISLANTGGLGKKGSLFLRGAETDHVVVLVDGIKINSTSAGTAALENIPLAQVARVEIVRGPRSSLYGADAIGGVIQIFTRQAQASFTPEFSLGIGSHSTQQFSAGVSGRNETGWYRLSASQLKTDGFDACRGKPFPDGGGCFTVEPDKDGFENQALAFSGGVHLGERSQLSVNAMTADSDVAFDGDFVNRTESSNSVLGATLKVAVREGWNLRLLAGQSKDDADNYKDTTFGSRFDTQRTTVSLQNDLQFGKNTLTVGVDQNRESISGTTAYTLDNRKNTGIFAQYQAQLGASDMLMSIRNDNFDDFGTETTGNLALGYALNNGIRLTAAYGTAFKAPTFNELYFPEFGNPDLTAETADSIDLGIRGNYSDNTRWAVNLYQTRTDNLIAYDAAAGIPVNIGESNAQGIELSLNTALSDWNLQLDVTHQKTENNHADHAGKSLPRRAENTARIGASRSRGNWSYGVNALVQGDSYDDLANTRLLNGFSVVNAQISYALRDTWTLGLAVNNLFDTQFETAEYYNQDGANGMLTLRYHPSAN